MVGADLAQVVLHGADRFAEVDPRAQVQRHEGGEHLLGDVAQRQVRQVLVCLVQPSRSMTPGAIAAMLP
jgi:hypothetical protein